jgi:serine phosphatase RsbU (regulator of sigma subunit)
MDPEGQQFGIERIREIVAAANGDPQETGDSLLTQIRHHMGSHPQDDDMCLVVFRRKE